MNQFEKHGIKLPEIFIPDTNKTDFDKWSVIACDQFTSNKDYWEDVKKLTAGKPSTFNLILPECYLKDVNLDEKLVAISSEMDKYINDGTLKKIPAGFVLVERTTPYTLSRQGLLIAIDLECYDYNEKSDSPIRPTEKTIIDRLPPRIKIRENASLDLPHILILIDDEDGDVIEYLYNKKEQLEKLYDFTLMKNGGSVKGWHVTGKEELDHLAAAFDKLARKNKTLFTVGDGNHSLAAAKEVWNKIKAKSGTPENHPARYALVEVVNIQSAGLSFEPIHRVVFNTDTEKLLSAFCRETGASVAPFTGSSANLTPSDADKIIVITEKAIRQVTLKQEDNLLAAEKLQSFLDKYLSSTGEEIDYIHGEKDLEELSKKKGNIGFLLPSISKKTFFSRITEKGVYPRKTFSIGESIEKRYYLESKIIKL